MGSLPSTIPTHLWSTPVLTYIDRQTGGVRVGGGGSAVVYVCMESRVVYGCGVWSGKVDVEWYICGVES